MPDTIDTLEIEVESSADGALKNLQSLKAEMEAFGKSLRSVMGDMSRFNLKDSFSKETKQAQMSSKSMADSLSKQWDIADQNIRSKANSIKKNISSLGDINFGTKNTTKIPKFSDNFISADSIGRKNGSLSLMDKLLSQTTASASKFESVAEQISLPSGTFSEFKKQIQQIFPIANALKTVLNGIGSVAKSVFKGIGSVARSAFKGIGSIASGIGRKISSVFSFSNIARSFTNVFGKLGRALKTAFSPQNIASGIKTLSSGLKTVLKHANPLISVFGSLKKAIAGTDNSMHHAGNKGNILGRALRFVAEQFKFLITYEILGKALEGVGDAMGVLAQRSSRFNSQLSQLIASCKTLGANIAAITVPLLNLFGPALTYVINLMNSAVVAINQFLSAFTGKTYTVATAGTYDYAASLDKAGSSADDANKKAKELQRTIMGFDELNVLNSNPDDSDSSSGGSGGGGAEESPGYDYSEMAINPKILEMVEKIKEIAAQIFDPMKQAWENKGKAVIEAWKGALDSVKQLAIDIGNSFLDVWTNGTGKEFCENILDIVIDIGDAVNVFAKSLNDAWNDGGAGTAYVQSIFDSFNAVLDLVHSIDRSLISVWSNGTGKEFFSNILAIMTNINDSVTNLATRFREAWEAGGVGTQIVQNVADIVNTLLGYAKDVTGAFKSWTTTVDFSGFMNGLNEALEAVKNGNFERVGEIVGNGITAVLKEIDNFITWDSVTGGLTKITKNIANFLNGLIAGINWNTLGKTFADGLNLIIDAAYNFVTTFSWKKFGTSIGEAIDGFISNIKWGELGKTISDSFKGILEGLSSAIKAINWESFGKDIAKFLTSIDWIGILADVGVLICDAIIALLDFGTGLAKGVVEGLKNMDWNNAASKLWKLLGKAWEALGKILSIGLSLVKKGWTSLKDFVGDKIEATISLIKKGWTSLTSWVGTKVSAGVSLVKKGWRSLSSWVGTKVSAGISLVKKGWRSLSSWVGTKASVSISLLKKGWKGIKDWLGIKNPLDIGFKFPKFKLKWGTKDMGFLGTVKYPTGIEAYEKGGFPEEGPFFMNRGEIAGKFSNGKTVVANNEQIEGGIARGIAPAVYDAVSAAIRNNQSSGNGNSNGQAPVVEITLVCDSETIFKLARKGQMQYNGRYKVETAF